jgi:hypothetical protein
MTTTLLPLPTAPPILWLEDAAAAGRARGLDDHDGFVVPGRLYPGVVEQAYQRLAQRVGQAEPLVAVHRAAPGEQPQDSVTHETTFAVRGAEDLVDAIRSCRASARADRAVEHRRPDGRALTTAPPPVIVELLATADAAAQPAFAHAA